MKNLKIARKAMQLTQEELGEKINIRKSAISKYENGKAEPSQTILIQLSRVLNVSVDYLLGLEPPSTQNEFTLLPIERALIENFRSSSTEIKKATLRILNVKETSKNKKTLGEDIAEAFQKQSVHQN